MANGDQSLLGIESLQGLQSFGTILGISGIVHSAIGAFYSAESQRYALRSQALSLEFQRSIAGINARAAADEADAILQAGKREKGLTTLRFGQAKAASRTRLAASGVVLGVGSAAEVQTSIEAAKEIDSMTIERNAVRAAGAARARSVEFSNRSLLAGVSAANMRRAARTISPGLAAITSLIGGAGQVTSEFVRNARFERILQQNRSSF